MKCVEVSRNFWKSDSPSLKRYCKAPRSLQLPEGAPLLPHSLPGLLTVWLGQSRGQSSSSGGPSHPEAADPAPPGFWDKAGVGRLCPGNLLVSPPEGLQERDPSGGEACSAEGPAPGSDPKWRCCGRAMSCVLLAAERAVWRLRVVAQQGLGM